MIGIVPVLHRTLPTVVGGQGVLIVWRVLVAIVRVLTLMFGYRFIYMRILCNCVGHIAKTCVRKSSTVACFWVKPCEVIRRGICYGASIFIGQYQIKSPNVQACAPLSRSTGVYVGRQVTPVAKVSFCFAPGA